MGRIVAFSGIDGSGKTTVARLLVKKLKADGVKVMYHHEMEFTLFKAIRNLIVKLLGYSRAHSLFQHMDPAAHKYALVFSIIDDLIFWIDGLVSYIYFKLRSNLIIHDRWPYDHVLRYECIRKNSFMSLVFRIFPARPDVLVLFNIPPKVAYNRIKGTHSYDLDFYVCARSQLIKLAQEFRYELILNSNRPSEEIARDLASFLNKKRILHS